MRIGKGWLRMVVNKHLALQEWVQDFLIDGRYLYFENIDMYPNMRTIVPNYGDYKIRTDITGNIYKRYTFAFVGVEDFSQDTTEQNIANMQLFDDFNDWIVRQQKEGNFPDFGKNTFDYKLTPLQNMANLSTLSSDGLLAKYMLMVQIDYTEREDD